MFFEFLYLLRLNIVELHHAARGDAGVSRKMYHCRIFQYYSRDIRVTKIRCHRCITTKLTSYFVYYIQV